MITERDDQLERDDDRATLVWSLLVSGFVNLMLWVVLAWVIAFRTHDMAMAQAQRLETFTVTSSSLNIAKRTQPVPAQPNQRVDAQRQPTRQPQPKPVQPAKQETPKPQAQPTELAHITPHGTPQPHSAPKKQSQGTLAEELAQNEVAFQHEAQQINAQHSVLSVATIDPNQRA
jgi:outer membrane biosynthesis protein TonB